MDETPNHHVGNCKLTKIFVLNILESPRPLFAMRKEMQR